MTNNKTAVRSLVKQANGSINRLNIIMTSRKMLNFGISVYLIYGDFPILFAEKMGTKRTGSKGRTEITPGSCKC